MEDFRDRLIDALRARPPVRHEIPNARPAAVLIPIVATDPVSLVFTVRTDTVRSHKGQISFPGGALEPDEAASHAALREAHEEIDLQPAAVELIGELETFPTFVSGYAVTPVLGWLRERPTFTPNPAEVARVLDVPLMELNEEIHADPGFEHGGRTYPTEAWIWREHVIWGVTAYIIRRFLQISADAGLVEPPRGDPDWMHGGLP